MQRQPLELEIPANLEVPTHQRTTLTPSEVEALKAVLVLVAIILCLLPLAAFDVPLTSPLLALTAATTLVFELALMARLSLLGIRSRLFPAMPFLDGASTRQLELLLAGSLSAGHFLAFSVFAGHLPVSLILGLVAMLWAYPTVVEGPPPQIAGPRAFVIAAVSTAASSLLITLAFRTLS